MSIDLGDYRTYDDEIIHWLDERKELIFGYYIDERKKDSEIAKRDRWEPLRPNPFGDEFVAAREALAPVMATKTVRVLPNVGRRDQCAEELKLGD